MSGDNCVVEELEPRHEKQEIEVTPSLTKLYLSDSNNKQTYKSISRPTTSKAQEGGCVYGTVNTLATYQM